MKRPYLALANTLHTLGSDRLPSIEVIAFALSNINRFTGHVGQYSVAQHCVHASHLIGPEDMRLAALLHDAPEAIYGGISRPIKQFLGCENLAWLEDHYHNLIDSRYGVVTRGQAVKECDTRLLVTEARSFGLPLDFFPDVNPYYDDITPWPAEVAQHAFLDQFYKLTGGTRP